MSNANNMKLDKNYNIQPENVDVYTDSFDELVDLVVRAKAKGAISSNEAGLILELAFRHQNKKELTHFFHTIFNNGHNEIKQTLLMKLKTNRVSYVS